MNNRCKAITNSGEQCKLKAGPLGYCHIHDPSRSKERKNEREKELKAIQEKENLLKAPRFSQRKGFKNVGDVIQTEGMSEDLRNSIWNVLSRFYLNRYEDRHLFYDDPDKFAYSFWVDFLKRPIHQIPKSPTGILKEIFNYFAKCEWYEVYDVVEYVLNYVGEKQFQKAMNEILARELSGYRFVGGVVTEITNEQEIELLEKALGSEDFPSVRIHLKRALELMSDKQIPDYRNSIKESICAVESFMQAITGDSNASLGKGLAKIEKSGKRVSIHPALKSAYSKLYGYTSNEDGIRHAMLDEPYLTIDDARYFLLICTSFINYLKSKL